MEHLVPGCWIIYQGACPRLLSSVLSRRSNAKLIITFPISPLPVLSNHRHRDVSSFKRSYSVRVFAVTSNLVKSDDAIAKLLGETVKLLALNEGFCLG